MLAADLVNTAPGSGTAAEALPDAGALEVFLDAHHVVPRRAAWDEDLIAVRALRPRRPRRRPAARRESSWTRPLMS